MIICSNSTSDCLTKLSLTDTVPLHCGSGTQLCSVHLGYPLPADVKPSWQVNDKISFFLYIVFLIVTRPFSICGSLHVTSEGKGEIALKYQNIMCHALMYPKRNHEGWGGIWTVYYAVLHQLGTFPLNMSVLLTHR